MSLAAVSSYPVWFPLVHAAVFGWICPRLLYLHRKGDILAKMGAFIPFMHHEVDISALWAILNIVN